MSEHFNLQRRRLLARLGGSMAWLSLAACGGGSLNDPASPPPSGEVNDFLGNGQAAIGTPGAAVSPDLRQVTLDAVRSAVRGLLTAGPRFDEIALARAMLGMPGLQRVGISQPVQNVWAEFTDGRALVVPNNLAPTDAVANVRVTPQVVAVPRPERERLAAMPSGFDTPAILTARQYRQLDMFGAVPTDDGVYANHLCDDQVSATTLHDLRQMAVGRGFALPAIQSDEPPDAGFDNGVQGMSNISGDGVFFINACSAQVDGRTDNPRIAICVSTRADADNLARYDAELASGVLAHTVAMWGQNGEWTPYQGLAITPDFVRQNRWTFPSESIGILNLTGAPDLWEWITVLNEAGLRHILGWQKRVFWQRMLAFADDLIQFNLATNNLNGKRIAQNPEPRLRAYGVGETLSYLSRRGNAGDGNIGEGTFLLQEPSARHFVNSMLPTIDYITLREESYEIELIGQFGARADTDNTESRIVASGSEGKAFPELLLDRAADGPLSGDALRNPDWQGGRIRASLERYQLARGGYVQVFNGGRCSNVVPITHWEIPIRVVTNVDELTLTIVVNVHMRGDVHEWRLEPDGEPRNGVPQEATTCTDDTNARFEAGGSIGHHDANLRRTTTIDWSGSGSASNAGSFRPIQVGGLMNWSSRRISPLVIGVSAIGTFQQRTVVEQFDIDGVLLYRTETIENIEVALSAADTQSGSLEFGFTHDWQLMGAQFELVPKLSTLLPEPPQRMRRTSIRWPTVYADYPPRNDYGGT